MTRIAFALLLLAASVGDARCRRPCASKPPVPVPAVCAWLVVYPPDTINLRGVTIHGRTLAEAVESLRVGLALSSSNGIPPGTTYCALTARSPLPN